MKKSSLTPKQIFKKRIKQNKLITPNQACSPEKNVEKEFKPLNIKNSEKKTFKARDRELKDDPYHNPYALPERLRVTTKCLKPRKKKPVPFIMGEIRTVCDYYPTFYKVIEGRPIRSFCDIKVYMTHIRDITLFRANAGYLKEVVIQIETHITSELEDYEALDKDLDTINFNFITFAEESYNDAKYMQHLAEEKKVELENMTEQLEACSFEFVKLKNEVSVIVGVYDKLLMYRRFLNKVAPDWWRERYEGVCTLSSTILSKFFTYLESEAEESSELYKKSAVTLAQLQPQMYFRRPMELLTVFEFSNRQCLNYMEIETYFSADLVKTNKYRQKFKKQMTLECIEMQEVIQMFRNKVQVMQERKTEFQAAFYKLLNTEFQRLFASYDSIKLFTCVQYVHTRIFGVKGDRNDNLKTLMLNLENEYYMICSNLEQLNQKVVKVAEKQFFSGDLDVMKKAYDAQRQLKEYNVLCKALRRSFEPSKKTRN